MINEDEKDKIIAKIDDFLMDDVNLSTHFNLQFNKSINNTINIDNLHNIELKDLIVTDEQNRILYASDKTTFDEYCKENNLSYNYTDFNQNYMNSGLNSFISAHDDTSNSVILAYNMYSDGYPKSKILYFHFNTIVLTENSASDTTGKEVTLNGNWNMTEDVPEEMYDRQSTSYRVVSCDNIDFNVYKATVSNTGFEIGITISNMPRPTNDSNVFSMETIDNLVPIRVDPYDQSSGETIEDTSYVENSKGQKFECTFSPSRKQDSNYIDGNKFDFYDTFGMTSYDATDNITVRLMFRGSPVVIELERVN